MKLINGLKSNSYLRRIVKKIKIRNEYINDYKQFSKYYMDSKDEHKQLEYKILFIAHSLEKGMTHKKLRPFGEQKILDILDCLYILDAMNYKDTTAYNIGISILKKWKENYDINQWNKPKIYFSVSNYINSHLDSNMDCKAGVFVNYKNNYNKYYGFDYLDAIKTRHSVRDFAMKKLKNDDIVYCVQAAMSSPSACNRQMCKVYFVDSDELKEELSNMIMGLTGFNRKVINLFIITYDVSAFLFYGERNQGYFNAGLFAMNFVNALHFKGIGSCFLQWGNKHSQEQIIKKHLGIPDDEKIVIALAAGYYKDKTLIPKSQRKKITEMYKKI